jgi:hypothetical protein
MANPTGTTYLSALATYGWADGDVYEIPQTDTVEGAASGASFGGLGVANQPHQLLLDKINLVRANMLNDEANIAALQALVGLFTSHVGASGYVKVGSQDENLGQITLIWQWGSIIPPSSTSPEVLITFAFPTAFLHAVWVAYAFPVPANTMTYSQLNTSIDPNCSVVWPPGLSGGEILFSTIGAVSNYSGTIKYIALGY